MTSKIIFQENALYFTFRNYRLTYYYYYLYLHIIIIIIIIITNIYPLFHHGTSIK